MVFNINVKCNTCGKIFRLRWQIGYNKADINIICPKCKTHIGATLYVGSKHIFKNLSLCDSKDDGSDGDYLVEVSTEFFTKKITSDTNRFSPKNIITPFIRNSFSLPKDYIDIIHYGEEIRNINHQFEKIYDLYKNKSFEYLKKMLRSEEDKFAICCRKSILNYRLNTELDLLIGTHQYLKCMINNCMKNDTHKNIEKILRVINLGLRVKTAIYKDFLSVLSFENMFEKVNNKFVSITMNYLEIFFDLIPLYLCSTVNLDLNEYGINTIDLEKLIILYKKCYEFLGEFIILPIGLNNIEVRLNANVFYNGRNNPIFVFLESISSKYSRYNDFLLTGEPFSDMFLGGLDYVIRNSEAHFDYIYDQIDQRITFINNNKGNKTYVSKYMIEFGNDVINIYQKCVLIWEICYQLQKGDLLLNKGTKLTFGI